MTLSIGRISSLVGPFVGIFLGLCGRVQGASYDPRLLVFEFNCNMILRASQVRLVAKFVKAYKDGKSLCHQVSKETYKQTY